MGILIIKVISDISLILVITSYLFPLLITKTLTYGAYVCIISLYAYYFLFKNLHKISYHSCIEAFNKGLLYIGTVFVISIFSNKLLFFEDAVIAYIFIYFISSIVLLRLLRYTEYNKNDKNINLINFRYSVLVILLSFILSIKLIRNLLSYTLYQAYHFIMSILISMLSWILFGIGYVLQYFIMFFNTQLINMNQHQVSVQPQHSPFENMENIKRIDIFMFFKNNIFVNLFIQISIIAIIVLFFIRIFRKHNNFSHVKEEYTESKEFITINKERNLIKRLQNKIKAKNPIEYIRFYYLKYLKMCVIKRIDIKNSDTTLDVYNKSKIYYDSNEINKLREIYIKARYSDMIADNKLKKEFISLFKKL